MNRGWTAGAALALAITITPARAETFTVGVEDIQYYPHYTVENGTYKGFARDLLDAFAADAGHTFVYKPMPVKRLFQALLGKAIDFKYPDNAYWAAEAKGDAAVTYSAPVVRYIDGVVVRPDRLGQGVDAVKTLGTVSGFTPFAWLERVADGRVRLAENADYDALLRQVMAGRVDGAYANVDVAEWRLTEVLKTPGAVVYDPALPHTDDFYHLSTTTRPDVIAAFDTWLAAHQELVAALKVRHGIGD